MFLIGLTGGIAAGKSTVAKIWSQLGAREIDADALAREAVAEGTEGLEEVVKRFGKSVIDSSGKLDRKALASLVFKDPAARDDLEQIIHPRVKALAKALVSQQPAESIVVYNVPLLVEANVDLPFDRIVTVEAPIEEQIRRLIENRGFTDNEARARIESQASSAARANRADFILNSNQDIEALEADAIKLWRQLESEAASKA